MDSVAPIPISNALGNGGGTQRGGSGYITCVGDGSGDGIGDGTGDGHPLVSGYAMGIALGGGRDDCSGSACRSDERKALSDVENKIYP